MAELMIRRNDATGRWVVGETTNGIDWSPRFEADLRTAHRYIDQHRAMPRVSPLRASVDDPASPPAGSSAESPSGLSRDRMDKRSRAK